MATEIQWAEETWSPVSGCTKVSAGCANCYADLRVREQPPWLRKDDDENES